MPPPDAEEGFSRLDYVILAALAAFVLLYLAPLLDLLRPGMEDEGDALDVGLRVTRGQIPYIDFFYFTPPAGMYITGGWLALFGSTLCSFRSFLLTITVVSTIQLYLLARKVMSPWWCVAAMLCFVSQSIPIWPIVSYHWLEIPFFLGAVSCLDRYDRSGGKGWLIASGALAGTTGFILQDGIIPALALVISRFFLRTFRQAALEGLGLIAGMGLGVLPWLLLILVQGSFASFWQDCITHVLFTGYVPFNRGLVEPMPWPLVRAGAEVIGQLSPAEMLTRWWEILDFFTWPLVMWVEYSLFTPLALVGVALAWRSAPTHDGSSSLKLYAVLTAVCATTAYCRLSYDIVHVTFVRHLWWVMLVWAFGALPWASSSRARWLVLPMSLLLAAACTVQLVAKRGQLAQGDLRVSFPRGTVRVADPDYARELDRICQTVKLQAGPDGPLMIYPFPGLLGLLLGNPSPVGFTRLMPIYNSPEHFEAAFEALRKQPSTTLLMRMDYPAFLTVYPAVPVEEFVTRDQAVRAKLASLARGPVIRATR